MSVASIVFKSELEICYMTIVYNTLVLDAWVGGKWYSTTGLSGGPYLLI